jgi:hypothetical protein
MSLLPSMLPVPLGVAQSMSFTGDLVAADYGWALAAVYLAGFVEPKEKGYHTYVLPDNGMRAALGLDYRDTLTNHVRRHQRLRAAKLGTIALPHYKFELEGTPNEFVSNSLGAKGTSTRDWTIHPAAVEMWRRASHFVYIPLKLLQRTDCKYSVPLFLRMLAWNTGGAEARTCLHKRDGDKLIMRLPMSELGFLNTPKSMRPSAIIDALQVAAAEIAENTDWSVVITPRIVRTKAAPAGRIRDIEIHVYVPELEEQPQFVPVIDITDGKTWRRQRVYRNKYRLSDKPRADTTNVTVLGARKTDSNAGQNLSPVATGTMHVKQDKFRGQPAIVFSYDPEEEEIDF